MASETWDTPQWINVAITTNLAMRMLGSDSLDLTKADNIVDQANFIADAYFKRIVREAMEERDPIVHRMVGRFYAPSGDKILIFFLTPLHITD